MSDQGKGYCHGRDGTCGCAMDEWQAWHTTRHNDAVTLKEGQVLALPDWMYCSFLSCSIRCTWLCLKGQAYIVSLTMLASETSWKWTIVLKCVVHSLTVFWGRCWATRRMVIAEVMVRRMSAAKKVHSACDQVLLVLALVLWDFIYPLKQYKKGISTRRCSAWHVFHCVL